MNNYPELKCPKCGGIIIHDDTYLRYISDDYLVNLCTEHCDKCETEYQWEEEFEIKFDGIVNLVECT